MIKNKFSIRYIIGFLMMIISYSTVSGARTSYEMTGDRLIEVSQGFFIPFLIGVVLVYPLFTIKSKDSVVNMLRLVIGTVFLGYNLIKLFSLLDWAFGEISGYDISIFDYYSMNSDFAAWIFLLSARMILAGVILIPALKMTGQEYEGPTNSVKRNNIPHDMKSIFSNFQIELKQFINMGFKADETNSKHADSREKSNASSNYLNNVLPNTQGGRKVSTMSISENKTVDDDKIEIILKYKNLLDEDIITQEEFEKQKQKILDR